MKTYVLVLVTLYSLNLSAQTADEIVNKHIEAIGGRDVINNIKTQVMETEMNVMGSSFISKSKKIVGVGYKSEVNYMGQDIVHCITPTSGWMINPLQGIHTVFELTEDQVKASQSSLEAANDLYSYSKNGSKLELAGREDVDGVNTFKLKLIDKEAKSSFFYIDPKTFYLVKEERTSKVNGQETTMTMTFHNFRKTPIGFVMPYTTVTEQGYGMTININKVEFNKEIDPVEFNIPKSED